MENEKVSKVRGIYYKPNEGILLVMTPKSRLHNRYTTPGGEFREGEDVKERLLEFIENEVGMRVKKVSGIPITKFSYKEKCPMDKSKVREINVYPYLIDFYDSIFFSEMVGKTPSNLDYMFVNNFSQFNLNKIDINITSLTKRMVRNPTFADKMREIDKGFISF